MYNQRQHEVKLKRHFRNVDSDANLSFNVSMPLEAIGQL
jgi:hypothetical protein